MLQTVKQRDLKGQKLRIRSISTASSTAVARSLSKARNAEASQYVPTYWDDQNIGSKTKARESKSPSKFWLGTYAFCKRAMDIVGSSLALLVLSPVFLTTAVAIKLDDHGPALYSQTRVGKNGKFFRIYKFRSMYVDADKHVKELMAKNESDGLAFKIKHDPRITRVGRFIRKTSIDELPQLWNIFNGTMSIVGPRPPLGYEVYRYNRHQMLRLRVKPGLTCYWQCNGRSDVSFDEWMNMDIQYIRDRSLWTDIKIILKTIPAVLFNRGAY